MCEMDAYSKDWFKVKCDEWTTLDNHRDNTLHAKVLVRKAHSFVDVQLQITQLATQKS